MNLRLRNNIPPLLLRFFSVEQLAALAEAFDVVPLNPQQTIVTISMTQPADTRYPWQRTDAEGRYLGPLKRYSAGGVWV